MMKEIIESMKKSEKADYLLDTCFVFYMLEKGHEKELEKFCAGHSVGMTSFNLLELQHAMHRKKGTELHHIREFLKKGVVSVVDVEVMPGEREKERKYVEGYDPAILKLVRDPSDAVMFVVALKSGADILTRDRHHVFTAAAENYSEEHGVEVHNNLPKDSPGKTSKSI